MMIARPVRMVPPRRIPSPQAAAKRRQPVSRSYMMMGLFPIIQLYYASRVAFI
jgi:hypothetical protein